MVDVAPRQDLEFTPCQCGGAPRFEAEGQGTAPRKVRVICDRCGTATARFTESAGNTGYADAFFAWQSGRATK